MLIVSRKKDESLVIGDVVLTIKKVKGSQVKIGIKAPKEVAIRRGELKPKETTE